MKSFDRVKRIHEKEYLYKITPYYDAATKKIKQRSKYIGIVKDGKPVESTVKTYSYGDLIPVMKAMHDLNIDKILKSIAPDYADLIMIMAINRIIRHESMNNISSWFDDTYLSTLYDDLDLSSQNISKCMGNIGRMDINHAYLNEILKITEKTEVLYYDITSFSSYSRNMEFLEFGYSRSDPNLPQVNVSMIQDRKSGIPIFYDLYPGSVVDVSTVMNTVEILKSSGIDNTILIMDRGMFSSTNIDKLLSFHKSTGIEFIMPATYTLNEVKRIAILSRRTIERGINMVKVGDDIIFTESRDINISGNVIKAWVYYQPGRDKIEREAFYSSLYARIDRIKDRKIRKYERIKEIAAEIMGPYLHFISWKYEDKFIVNIREKAVSQRVNRCGITILTFLGDFNSVDALTMYRERDSVEKLFLNSKSFLGAEPLRVHGMDTLKGHLFVNLIALTVRSHIIKIMGKTKLIERYSLENMLLELHKIRKVRLQNNREIITEITKKQREILESLSIPMDHVPTFLRS